MKISPENLQRLEQNSALKERYLMQKAWGYNQLVYLPSVLLLLLMLCYWILHKNGMLLSWYTLIDTVLIMLCCLWIRGIQLKVKKMSLRGVDSAIISLCQKVYGNSVEDVYYCIYTVGKERHNPDFIRKIAYKIFKIEEEPDVRLRNKIDNMFAPRLEALRGEDAKLLPVEFTYGEKVYQKVFHFKLLSKALNKLIEENDGMFIILPFDEMNVPILAARDYVGQ